ncbi:MAG: hypothetical protein DRJ45_07105 [Thermoprotei archaeon]|nr:MAG: hypothetical protein DRJ45_07105 [Thermoprotei archaeon]
MDPGAPELLQPPAQVLLHFRPYLVVPAGGGLSGGALAAGEEDGGADGTFLAGMGGGLHLGVNWPGGGGVEAGGKEALDELLPGGGGAVGEHDYGDPVGFEHSVNLAEGLGEEALEVFAGDLLALFSAAPAGGVVDDLLVLGGEFGFERLGVEIAHGALEPDVEEVREICVGHVVVIGRIDDDGIEGGISKF